MLFRRWHQKEAKAGEAASFIEVVPKERGRPPKTRGAMVVTSAPVFEVTCPSGFEVQVPRSSKGNRCGSCSPCWRVAEMLPSTVRILACTASQDMRSSFDLRAAVVRDVLGEEPQGGALYVFVGKRPTRVKVLWWDRNGYCLLYKRLHRALFVPPNAVKGAAATTIDGAALHQLLSGRALTSGLAE